MINVACLLLAAGKSRRMGGANKLLLELDGQTVLERVVTQIQRAPFSDVVAVTGFESALVERELSLFELRVVRNPAFESGMHSSIRRGLQALPANGSAFFAVCLSDQPFLKAVDLTHSASALAFYDVDTPDAFAHARHMLIGTP